MPPASAKSRCGSLRRKTTRATRSGILSVLSRWRLRVTTWAVSHVFWMRWLPEGQKSWMPGAAGPGRVKQLHALGHRVTGVDIDPELIDEATRVCPEASWVTADLADLPQALGFNGEADQDGFELLVCSGNVMGFLARSTRYPVVENFYRVLAPGGRAVVGYGSGPGRDYSFEQFLADARQAGFNVDATYSTWDLRPFTEDSEYLVAVLSRAK